MYGKVYTLEISARHMTEAVGVVSCRFKLHKFVTEYQNNKTLLFSQFSFSLSHMLY